MNKAVVKNSVENFYNGRNVRNGAFGAFGGICNAAAPHYRICNPVIIKCCNYKLPDFSERHYNLAKRSHASKCRSTAVPIVRIDNSLEKYKNMPIFQEKLDMANEVLRTIGPPAIYFECER